MAKMAGSNGVMAGAEMAISRGCGWPAWREASLMQKVAIKPYQ